MRRDARRAPTRVRWDPGGRRARPGHLAGRRRDRQPERREPRPALDRARASARSSTRASQSTEPPRTDGRVARAAPCRRSSSPPPSASTANRGDEILTEESEPGTGFLADVVRAWEAAADPAREAGIRVVHLRQGIVLSRDGGASSGCSFPSSSASVVASAAASSGGAGSPWTTSRPPTATRCESDLAGAVNLTSPNPVTNEQFTKALGTALHRPTVLPGPGVRRADALRRDGRGDAPRRSARPSGAAPRRGLRVRGADDRRRHSSALSPTSGFVSASATMAGCPTSRRSDGTTRGVPPSSRTSRGGLVPGRVAVQHRGAYDVVTDDGRAAQPDHESPAPESERADLPGRRRLGRARLAGRDRRGRAAPNDDLAPRRTRAGIRRLARAGHRRERRRRSRRRSTRTGPRPPSARALRHARARERRAARRPPHEGRPRSRSGGRRRDARRSRRCDPDPYRLGADRARTRVRARAARRRDDGRAPRPVRCREVDARQRARRRRHRLATAAVRADGAGRHTTTRRELVLLPGRRSRHRQPRHARGAPLDRRRQLEDAFDDIAELAASCRFSDCRHETEPGCAVLAAVASGTLARERWESYRALERELAELAERLERRERSRARRRPGAGAS